jgi:thiazole synthase
MSNMDHLQIGTLQLDSRVLLGTALYPDRQTMFDCITASDTSMVTISLRRVSLQSTQENLYSKIQNKGLHLLPNTAGCFSAKEAILTAELAREALETNRIKLEVIADEETLLPEPEQLLIATEKLVRLGFEVYPYTNDDPIMAKKLEDLGCVCVMPLAAPIGTGLGVRNPHNLEMIVARANVPVIVDAGIGTASDITKVFELGCSAVLLNTAVARARHPIQMASAVKHAAIAGRMAYLAGRMPSKKYAESASPLTGKAWT